MSIKDKVISYWWPVLFLTLLTGLSMAALAGMLPPTPGVEVPPLDATGKVPAQYLPASSGVPQKLLNMTTVHVTAVPGRDLGVVVNAAINKLGGNQGTVILDQHGAPFTYSTTIRIFKGATVDAQNSVLKWNRTDGVAVYYGDTGGSLHKGGLKNCVLTTVAGYSAGHTDIGIYNGGDPAGVISTSGSGGAFMACDNVDISGFKYGYTFGNNTWELLFDKSAIHDCYDGVYDPGGQTNSGEEMMLASSPVFNNTHNGLNLNSINNEWVMLGGSLDYNTVGAGGTGSNFSAIGVHMEQSNAPLISFSTAAFVSLTEGEYAATAGSGTDTAWFRIAGGTSSRFHIDSPRFATNHNVTYVYDAAGADLVSYSIKDPIYVTGTPIPDISSCNATYWYSQQSATQFSGQGMPSVMGQSYGWIGAHFYNPSLWSVPGGRYSYSIGSDSNINPSNNSIKLSFISYSGTNTNPNKGAISIGSKDVFLWDQLGNIGFPPLTTNGYLKTTGGNGTIVVDSSGGGAVTITPSQVICVGGTTESGQTTFDASAGNEFSLDLAGVTAVDLKPLNGQPGQQISLAITGGGAPCTLYLSPPFSWSGGGLFSGTSMSGTCTYLGNSHATIGAGAVYHVSFIFDGTYWKNAPLFPNGNGSGLTGITASQVGAKSAAGFAQYSSNQVIPASVKIKSLGDVLAKANAAGTGISIALYGTSITYSQDTTATGTNPAINGATQTRSGKTIDAALGSALGFANFSGTTTVINRGYPGDTTIEGISRWSSASATDVSFIEYAHNDANNYGSYGHGPVPIANYRQNLATIIAREINKGAAVIVLGPPPVQDPVQNEKIRPYGLAARQIANAYGVPFVDLAEVISTVNVKWTDGVHLTTYAYNEIGWQLAALFYHRDGAITHVSPGDIYYAPDAIGHGGSYYSYANAKGGANQIINLAAGQTYAVGVFAEQDVQPFIHTINTGGGTFTLNCYYAGGKTATSGVISPGLTHDITYGARQKITGPTLRRGYRTLLIRNDGSNAAYIEAIEFRGMDSLTFTRGLFTKSNVLSGIVQPRRASNAVTWFCVGDFSRRLSDPYDIVAQVSLTSGTDGIALFQSQPEAASPEFLYRNMVMIVRDGNDLLIRELVNGGVYGTDSRFTNTFSSANPWVGEVELQSSGGVLTVYTNGAYAGQRSMYLTSGFPGFIGSTGSTFQCTSFIYNGETKGVY